MYTYLLKIVNADMTTKNKFKWKKRGLVTSGYFSNDLSIGPGLYGFKINEIDINTIPARINLAYAKFLILRVEISSIIDLDGKCKFPEAYVIETFDNIFSAAAKWKNLCQYYHNVITNYDDTICISFNNKEARGNLANIITSKREMLFHSNSYILLLNDNTHITLPNNHTVILNRGYYYISYNSAHLITNEIHKIKY